MAVSCESAFRLYFALQEKEAALTHKSNAGFKAGVAIVQAVGPLKRKSTKALESKCYGELCCSLGDLHYNPHHTLPLAILAKGF